MLINKYYKVDLVKSINETLGLHLPYKNDEYLTLKDMDNNWEALLAIPQPLIYDATVMYKNQWKELPMVLQTNKAKIFYTSPTEYLQINTKNEIVAFRGDGICKAIFSIYLSMKQGKRMSIIDQELTNWWKEHNKNPETLLNFYNEYLTKRTNQAKIDIIFNALETRTDFYRELAKRSSEKDIYKVKLLYILYFKETKDTSLIREYNIYEDAQMYNVDTLVDTIKQFLRIEVDAEKFVNRIDQVNLDESKLDYIAL